MHLSCIKYIYVSIFLIITGLKISDNTYASLLSTNNEYQYIKCTAWYPRPEPANLVAVGLATGRIVLTSFGKGSSQDPHRLCGKEFVPKHQRQCSYLAWNPVESNLLAEGLEKHRADYSVLIWDVYHQQRACFSEEPGIIQKTSVELGSSEITSSLAWFPQEPQSLVTGMSNKFLRIFDLRDTSRPQSAAYTKAVYGVKVDPCCQHRLASFHEVSAEIVSESFQKKEIREFIIFYL
ncbi:hypothetical protein LSH36_589g01037 [Paralvinella palmiformis]|uniref:Uncharacterized protein n=1 Tax=Paralvinella palmiformis TaxID=53620 RepID=A0AAD9MXK6_9ANNE|nr:hypothetical protein LSH36_589g01037 [Paralvinella palmiformis]